MRCKQGAWPPTLKRGGGHAPPPHPNCDAYELYITCADVDIRFEQNV